MRVTSKENNVIYQQRPRLSFTIRQRLTMVDLQTGEQKSYRTPNALVSVNQFSNEVGTTQQVKNILDSVNVETPNDDDDDNTVVGGWFLSLSDEGLIRRAFQNLTDFLSQDAGAGLNPNDLQMYRSFRDEDWPFINAYITVRLMKNVFRTQGYQLNLSLFNVLELQNLIRARIDGRANRFPFTFVKVREINLLDNSGNGGLKTIKEFIRYARKIFDDEEIVNIPYVQLKLLFIRYLGGDLNTSLDGLRPFARYRFIHEINVDLTADSAQSFPIETSLFGEGESASSGGGAKRRREGE